MAVPAPAKVARALAASAAVLVLLWCVHFRGGLSLGSPTNKGLIFNVHPVLMLIGFIILGSEVATWRYNLLLPWCFANSPAPDAPVARSLWACCLHSSTACGRVGFPGEAHLPSVGRPRQVQLGSPAGELHSSFRGTSWRFCCALCHCSNAQRARAWVFSSAQALSH
ncbi:hypothetical protein C2845_PM01G38590 [Panicum miliaceum]|uniref:Cytochrome b561 domain-containing protein n=1 Tax=Panicum miliaceum TaxID=4540 RepID=A0A3L6TPC6_PANMI|nr:hypothetical protein C2845_PM01G38590 [Panicum miliaceum]